MKNLAHRGYSAYYPENTMEAFLQALAKGFDGLETDVHMSKDGELVLIHDEKINRTSDGKGYVKDMTLRELRRFNYRYKYDGHHDIPTLKELLEVIKGKDFIVNLEIKTDKIHYHHIEAKTLKLVKEMGVEDQVIYSSFYLPTVLKVKELKPDAYVGYLMEWSYKKKIKELYDNDITAFHPRYTYLNKERINELKKRRIMIASWTIPNINEYSRLKELGVDIIISNEYFK